MKLTCKGCIDYETCLLDERKKNKRCEHYTRTKVEEETNYTESYIKKMEVSYDPKYLDSFLPMEAIRRIRGGKRKTFNREENQ